MKNYILILASLLIGSTVFAQTTWYEIPVGTDAKLNAVDFPSLNVGYIVGEDTTILKTTDGGQTWAQLELNGINVAALADDFKDILFHDENTGFIVTGYSGVYKTTDGGQSWAQVQYNMCFPQTVYPFGSNDYLIGGGDCFTGARIDKVVNSVATPAAISTNFWFDYEIVMEMSFNDLNLGLAAVRNQYILRTTDGGSNWDTIPTNAPGALTSVVMVDDMLCYAGFEDPNSQGFGILKSVDGGLTWDHDVNSATFYYPSYLTVVAADNGDIYSGGFSMNSPGGLIFESVDGISWDYQNVDQPINGMTSIGSDITFGVGDSGYVVVNTPIAELSLNEPDQLQFDVYPNPVLDELTIENPQQEAMEVTILDAGGRILKTEKVLPGLSKINISYLSRGMYVVEVKTGNKFGQKRIIK